MKRVLDEIDAGACLLDDRGRIAAANDRLAAATGRSAADLVGERLETLLESPTAPLDAADALSSALAGGGADADAGRNAETDADAGRNAETDADDGRNAETDADAGRNADPGPDPDGRTLTEPAVLRGEDGGVACTLELSRVEPTAAGGRSGTADAPRASAAVLCVFRRAAEAGSALPSALRQTLSATPIGAFTVGDDGSVGLWNPAMEDLLGWTESDVIGERPPFVPEGSEDVWHALRERVYDGETVREESLRVRTATRSPTTVSVSAGPVYEGSAIRGVLVVATDAGRKRRRERQLELLDRVMRHNIRNEMNLALGQADRLRERLDDPELVDIADDIADATEEVYDLSEKARTLKRVIESADTTETVPMAELASTMVERYREHYPAATIHLETGIDATARASPLVEAAVDNLVENAIEHNDGDPTVWITVTVARQGDRDVVEVTVADDGPRLPEHERRVLAEENEDVLQHGSGIGLWLVYWIVKESNGELVYEPRDPRGNELTIRLPKGIPGID